MREQLIAYLEGTLTPEQRREVALRLQYSMQWQRELTRVEQMQSKLRQQMPLLGQPESGQLESLLPGILERVARPPRRSLHWGGLQTMLMIVGLVAVLVCVPLLLHSTSVDAMVNWSQNVPVSTSTIEPNDGTTEALFAISDSEHVAVNVRYSASPVPMPGATLEPSREAFEK